MKPEQLMTMTAAQMTAAALVVSRTHTYRAALTELLHVRTVSAIQPAQVQAWQKVVSDVLEAADQAVAAGVLAVSSPTLACSSVDDGAVEPAPVPPEPADARPVSSKRVRDILAPRAGDPADRP